MNTDSKLAQLERNLKDAKQKVDLGNALERLRNHPDFRKIILEGYLKDEAVRLVHAKADPATDSPASQAAIVRDIDAIGAFAGFLREVDRQAYLASKEISDGELARELILEDGDA